MTYDAFQTSGLGRIECWILDQAHHRTHLLLAIHFAHAKADLAGIRPPCLVFQTKIRRAVVGLVANNQLFGLACQTRHYHSEPVEHAVWNQHEAWHEMHIINSTQAGKLLANVHVAGLEAIWCFNLVEACSPKHWFFAFASWFARLFGWLVGCFDESG